MSQPLVRATGLSVRLGGTAVLAQVDLQVCSEQRVALTGRSGSGKSTLLLALAGLIDPTAGSVAWPGLDGGKTIRRAQIGMVFQSPSLLPELTAAQNVQLPLRLRGVAVADAAAAASAALADVDAGDLGKALPGQLSGGQQQRVAVARVLAGHHRLVLADEPTGSLDRSHAHAVVRTLIDRSAADGSALVLATHDQDLVELFSERIAITDGRASVEALGVTA